MYATWIICIGVLASLVGKFGCWGTKEEEIEEVLQKLLSPIAQFLLKENDLSVDSVIFSSDDEDFDIIWSLVGTLVHVENKDKYIPHNTFKNTDELTQLLEMAQFSSTLVIVRESFDPQVFWQALFVSGKRISTDYSTHSTRRGEGLQNTSQVGKMDITSSEATSGVHLVPRMMYFSNHELQRGE